MGNRLAAGINVELDPSFDDFVRRGSARLLRSAYLLTGDRHQAEDLLQVALVRTARHWDTARAAPDAYAHRVIINLLHDRVTEEPFEALDDASLTTGADHADGVIERDAILNAMKLLADRQREVVVLRFFADLSVSETAAAIGSSEGTVKTHTSRALQKLRVALENTATPPTTPKDL